ncbi:MAG: hypothetical protein ISS23_03760 [Nanoarchaeota archaeon]|nr:hypothetical protein [Nanoarchaeota archaeon]
MADFKIQELKNQILEIVKKEGPILPVQISQKVVSNILFTSAILSDLIRQNQIKISKAKIGNSPVYYTKGQEQKLQLLYKHLSESPRKVYDLIKEKKILKDKELEPWQRVAVRELKDFATMLIVNYKTGQEIFWKWYLMPEEEAKQKITDLLKKEIPAQKKEGKKEPEKKEEKQTKIKESKKPERIDGFYGLINNYFTENRLKVLEEKALRKNTEYEFTIEVPSTLGNLKYFVKAKNKKKIGDAELNMSYTSGEKKKLPTMFISTGELTKKAEKFLETELKGLIFKRIR